MIFDRFSSSFRDSLSGLFCEAYFAEVFQREWQRVIRENDSLSIVVIHPHLDIDNFDDQLSFKLISETIENATKRASDLACRFQSNQIVIGLFNIDQAGTETIIHRIIDCIDPQLSELVIDVNLSIGALNVAPTNQIEINEVFEHAEQLADLATKTGKNNYQLEYYRVHQQAC